MLCFALMSFTIEKQYRLTVKSVAVASGMVGGVLVVIDLVRHPFYRTEARRSYIPDSFYARVKKNLKFQNNTRFNSDR